MLSPAARRLPIFCLHPPCSSKLCHILRQFLFVSLKVNHKPWEVSASPQRSMWEAPLTKSHCDTFINTPRLIENGCWVEETRKNKSSLSPGNDLQDSTALSNKTKVISQTCKHFSANCWSHRLHFSVSLGAAKRKQAGRHYGATDRKKVLCLGHCPAEQVTCAVPWAGTVLVTQDFITERFLLPNITSTASSLPNRFFPVRYSL